MFPLRVHVSLRKTTSSQEETFLFSVIPWLVPFISEVANQMQICGEEAIECIAESEPS